jgi:transcriptional regulator with XRE-family HTH domain
LFDKEKYLKEAELRIADKIRTLRISNGLARKQMADMLNVSDQQIGKYETGQDRISNGRLSLLAYMFNEPIDYFFDGNAPVTGDTTGQRLCLELVRRFVQIKSQEHKEAVYNLVKTLAGGQNV